MITPGDMTQTGLEKNSGLTPEHKAQLLGYIGHELARFEASINPLLELRHKLFVVPDTQYVGDLSIADQLYSEPSYDAPFAYADLSVRAGGTLEYHNTSEKYDSSSDESAERDAEYRQAILATAQELGFVSKNPGIASDPLDRELGILDSETEPIAEKVAAIVINGGAGISNHKRLRDAIRNIESGVINTETIILSGGTRPVGDAEKGRIKPPFHGGDTEYELMKSSAEDLLGVRFDDEASEISVGYGDNLTAKVEKSVANIGGRLVTIIALEAPYDPTKTLANGKLRNRINTEEAFAAALPIVKDIEGAIVMESHDTWVPWQNLVAIDVFGREQGRNVYPVGPFNAERVFLSEKDGQPVMDIASPQDVVDEMVKTYRKLVSVQTALKS